MPRKKVELRSEMPTDRALRWEDIGHHGQTSLNAQVKPLGRAVSRERAATGRQKRILANPNASEKALDNATRRLAAHGAIKAAGGFTDVDITHEGAAQRRVDLATAGAARTATPEHQEAGVTASEDWYFQHHGKLAAVAKETGHDKARVIAASASMSPQNSPDQELEAVHALARAHSDKTARITITPEAAEKLRPTMPNVDDYVGKATHPKRFSPEDLAAVSSPDIRDDVQTRGNVDLEGVAKGGVHGNVVKAINVLRGNVKPEEAIDPKSSPKVWSYHEGIKNSVPGTPEHEEFMTRMDVALRRPNQSRLDLFGLASSKEGILSPSHPTAEDTWMQAISTGQQLRTVSTGLSGKQNQQSPAKFSVGEGGVALDKQLRSGKVIQGGSPSSVMHAWQSHATEMAAGALSERTGGNEIVPAVGVQAAAWTEARREASGGKDKTYEDRMSAFHAARNPEYAKPPEMFTPSGNVTAAAKPHAQGRLALGGAIPEAMPQAKPKSRKKHFEGESEAPPSLF